MVFAARKKSGLFFCTRKKRSETGQDDTMDKCVIFFVGAVASTATEAFWKGESRMNVALWGGTGMLLLRRIILRFPYTNRSLLCILGALLLLVLWLAFLMLRALPLHRDENGAAMITLEMPSFSYGLFRFLLIAPAYAVIEYLEACFGI